MMSARESYPPRLHGTVRKKQSPGASTNTLITTNSKGLVMRPLDTRYPGIFYPGKMAAICRFEK